MDFKGFLKDFNGLDSKDQKLKGQANGSRKMDSLRSAWKMDKDKDLPEMVPQVSQLPGSLFNDEKLPDAASEKDLGNEYFKQKKFLEAIDCYSRSIALSPTAVAFANRAMAYLKVKRFEEAENDCTEALNLDDRYIKAYSRRATARKELGKLRASMEDCDFAIRLEPNNEELRKQYSEAKALLEKKIGKKKSGPLKNSTQAGVGNPKVVETDALGIRSISSNAQNAAATAVKSTNAKPDGFDHRKQDVTASVQDLAARAASRVMANAGRNITAPKSAYEFEVSWRALSDDSGKQAQLLKAIPPATLPQIFKNALSAPMLIEIVKSTATFFKEETELAMNILDNLTKVPRFDMIVMCLSAVDRSELHRIWEEVFSSKNVNAYHEEALSRLRSRYC